MTVSMTHQRLRAYTQEEDTLRALHDYLLPSFVQTVEAPKQSLEDAALVETWEGYLMEAKESGVYPTLCRHWVQFRFPIAEGISNSDSYRRATRRGASTLRMPEAHGLALKAPDRLKLFLYASPAGRIPVLVAEERVDFEAIIRALCYCNEPRPVPASMGAALIKGLNNWSRVRKLQALGGYSNLSEHKDLFQDSVIVLSRIPYSNVPATVLGLEAENWLEQSLQIRLAHEGAHYFTLRRFGSMHINMYDELIADYAGIKAVQPHFRAEWFLRFIGLKDYPRLREAGRLNNYLGEPPLDRPAREALQAILRDAALQVEAFDHKVQSQEGADKHCQLLALCHHSLLEMSAPSGKERLLQTFYELQQSLEL
ncbi:hypothetical protein [Phaeodactylibacter sp.]|uniref:DUF7005 family protein n=1 Tax=Phaeodactylibacter sp. TaxID=1940289 RepID=UPI0025F1364E|nr:hypothetical protein [Phaeodactylibacter sp.]MCI4651033.1 hypothetical protein [Phaeodactylibacter sp.]MCI5093171.1 hypothetical protein [Phaeodactylibacter sp.]